MSNKQLDKLLKQEKKFSIESDRLAKKIAKDVLKIKKINLKWEEKSNEIDWLAIELEEKETQQRGFYVK
jgi:hypothetical protein